MARNEPISWKTARSVAARVASKEPFSRSYLASSMDAQFDALTSEAEERVAETTGLPSLRGPARARVVDRPEWAAANIASMRRLLSPALARVGNPSNLTGLVGRQVTAAELGAVLGWMSSRVLGQYDQVIDEAEAEEQDLIFYVAPNVLSLEKRYAFPPEEFRLWLALHECTHRAQFTGVPWMTPHFKSLVSTLLSSTDLDPGKVVGGVRRALQGNNDDDQGSGLVAAFANEDQRAALNNMMGLMSLLEGHGEVVMAEAGEGRVKNADRFHRVLHERRNAARGLTKIIQRVLGMEAKMKQYAQGAAFVRAVEARGGRDLFDLVWQAPEHLPSYQEIHEPERWLTRHGATAAHA